MYNRRAEIVNFLVGLLKGINGEVSLYDNSYTYQNNVFNNVYRQLRFIDEVNDFPSLYLSAGTESRIFHTENLTEASLQVTIRAYVYGEDNSQIQVDTLVEDIEHVIYNIGDYPEKGILDITIENITEDEGLARPYGIAEVVLLVVYRLED